MGPEGRLCLGKPEISTTLLWFHRGAPQKKQIEDVMVICRCQGNTGAVSVIRLRINPYDFSNDTDDELILRDNLIRCRVTI